MHLVSKFNKAIGNTYNLVNILCLLLFIWRDIHERYLSLNDVDDEQSNLAAKINNLEKVTKTEKQFFK